MTRNNLRNTKRAPQRQKQKWGEKESVLYEQDLLGIDFIHPYQNSASEGEI